MQETGPAEDDEPAGPANLPQEAPDSMFSAGFVPNVRIDASEMEQLRQAVNNPTSMQPLGDNPLQYAFPEDSPIILSLPVVRGTPISEHCGTSIDIDAFPTLFPNGKGSFQSVCEAPVTLQEWAGHLIRLDGGQFAQHPRFRYWVLNTIMRQTAKKASSWYCTKNPQDKALTVEEIREMLADNTNQDSEQLANRLVGSGRRCAQQFRGLSHHQAGWITSRGLFLGRAWHFLLQGTVPESL
jgi:hypothetical protein